MIQLHPSITTDSMTGGSFEKQASPTLLQEFQVVHQQVLDRLEYLETQLQQTQSELNQRLALLHQVQEELETALLEKNCLEAECQAWKRAAQSLAAEHQQRNTLLEAQLKAWQETAYATMK